MRAISKVAPGWWDYTTLNRELLDDAARLSEQDVLALSRPGFQVRFYDTVQEFYLAEALEYIEAWRQAKPGQPAGLCGPIGPTEQLPLVAQLVNALKVDLRDCHYWGMDEWVDDEGVPVPTLAASLGDRFYSRDRGDVAHKVLSAMRAGFGGHHEVKDTAK